MSWKQLKIRVTDNQAEEIANFLMARGSLAVTFEDAEDAPLFEPLPGETPLWRLTTLIALYPAEAELEPLTRELRGMVVGCGSSLIEVEALQERDWVRETMANFKPMRFGQRLWVLPNMGEVPDPDGVTIYLEPGLAFGTGSHPTTALCLESLEGLTLAGKRLIDFGCGSGILALAALKLGARSAVAIDRDPQALEATLDNARRNGATDNLTLYSTIEQLSGVRAEVVVANILAGTLIAAVKQVTGLVAPGGIVILSGILTEQVPAVVTAYQPQWHSHSVTERDGWCCIRATAS